MIFDFKVLVVDRKGEQITRQKIVDIDGKQKLEISPIWLSDSIAEALEKHDDRSIPYRKLMSWAIDLDKTGSIIVDDNDMQFFSHTIETSALLPFVKFQAMEIIEAVKNGS